MRITTKSCDTRTGKPRWLSRKLPIGAEYQRVRQIVDKNSLATVCKEANCPNQFECYSKGSATFMILGEKCTRNCRFCNVQHYGTDLPLDQEEPERVAVAVKELGLRYVVITSVTRDDLEDGGATIFARTIAEIRKLCPSILIEVLIPDLQGQKESLQIIIDARPDVLNHNVETVEKLYPKVRPQAIYERSLWVLKSCKEIAPEMITKTGLMVGLGESDEELLHTIEDISQTGCDILIMGQYLQPTREHVAVERFVSPDHFHELEIQAKQFSFSGVVAEPLVRSSYKAEELYHQAMAGVDNGRTVTE